MSRRGYFNPARLPDWSDMFSQIVTVERAGLRFIHLSGQVGVDRDKKIAGAGNLESQTRQAFKNIKIALSEAGAKMEDVVKMTIYVVKYKYPDAGILKTVIQENFPAGKLPALSLIDVAALAMEEFLIEIDTFAVADLE